MNQRIVRVVLQDVRYIIRGLLELRNVERIIRVSLHAIRTFLPVCQMQNGVTPLHVASHYDHQNVALLLLDKGASPHAMAKNGHTPLHIAARKNQVRSAG